MLFGDNVVRLDSGSTGTHSGRAHTERSPSGHRRAGSGQQTAVELLERLNAQLVRHRFQLALRPGRPQQSLNEHLAMIETIRARDPRAAEAAVRARLAGVIEALRD